MSDQDIRALFDAHPAPRASSDLSDRIVKAARKLPDVDTAHDVAANDNAWLRPLGLSAIAATLAAGLFLVLQPPSEAEQWSDHAEAAGFGDLYAWVYAEPS